MRSERRRKCAALFPEFRDMAANGLPLRSIFVALAKASRSAA